MLVRTPKDRQKRSHVPTTEFESVLTDLSVAVAVFTWIQHRRVGTGFQVPGVLGQIAQRYRFKPYIKMSYFLLRLLSALVSIVVAEWVLQVLEAPMPISWGTGLMIAYLFWVGRRGIFIASIWITLLVSLAIALDFFPYFWPENLQYRYWAMFLMLLWALAIVATWIVSSYLSLPNRSMPTARTTASILDGMVPQVRHSLSEHQLLEVERLIGLALPKPTPKLVELRIDIDLLIQRFYIVLLVGKDYRKEPRYYAVSRFTQMGNWLTAILLLMGFNLAVSVTVLLFAYLMKSALGIDLLPGHFRGFGK